MSPESALLRGLACEVAMKLRLIVTLGPVSQRLCRTIVAIARIFRKTCASIESEELPELENHLLLYRTSFFRPAVSRNSGVPEPSSSEATRLSCNFFKTEPSFLGTKYIMC